MNKSLNVSTKLIVLVILALAFAATMIALSVRDRHSYRVETGEWGSPTTMDKKFTVKSGDKLVVDADEGDVTITGTDGDELTVRVSERGSKDMLSQYHITFDQSGDVVTIRGKHERKLFHFFDYNSSEIHFDISLPRQFNLHLETSGGDMNISDVEGEMYGETSGGNIVVDKLKGKITFSTSGGNVEFANSSGDMSFETSGGNIKGQNCEGPLRVQTSGGNIRLTGLDGKVHAETSGGDIRLDAKDNKGIDLSTSGGSVVVNLPKNISGNVRAETTGGDVSCDFPFQGKSKDGSLNGTINGGGEYIRLESSGGDIEIHSVD